MTWLVIASSRDVSARWAYDRLSRLDLAQIEYVTDADLVDAIWQHEVSDDGCRTILTLSDGRQIDTSQVSGVLNRFTHIPADMVAKVTPDDREYARQELYALVLSWLHSFEGHVLNPPDAMGLCGAWRADAEWAMLAHDVDIPSLPLNCGEQGGGWLSYPSMAISPPAVVVIGDDVFSREDIDESISDKCRALTQRANTPILGLYFVDDLLNGATPLPDLRAGGDELIESIAHSLAAP